MGSSKTVVAFASIAAPSVNPSQANCDADGVSLFSSRKHAYSVAVARVAASISFVTYCARYTCIGRNAASKSPTNAVRAENKSRKLRKTKKIGRATCREEEKIEEVSDI